MSINSNRIVTFWKIVESQIRRSAIKRKGVNLSSRNNNVVQDALILLTLCWHDLLSLGSYPFQQSVTRWLDAILSTDFAELVACFKSADEQLLDYSITDYEGFKHSLKQCYPWSGAVLAPLKGLIEQWTNVRSIPAFSSLHTAFVFIGRLNLYGLSDLEDEAIADYLRIDSQLASVIPTDDEESIIRGWFPRDRIHVLMEEFSPKHGPGAVADNCKCLSDKYKHLGSDNLIHYLDNKVGWSDKDYPRDRNMFERTSKVVLVPKSVVKLRTICAEPTTLQWYQQGFLNSIRRYISTDSYLRRRIDLEDQGRNRDLAWEGSVDGSFTTIDLSAASDSVSWSLINHWFNHSALREILWCTRSRRSVLPNGFQLSMNKFAPMGSALCFPVECIVFSAMAEASIREVGDNTHLSRYCVYGDDIVIETKYAPTLIKRLEQNGFAVNTSKTFSSVVSPIFRESCGGEYLDGVDVSPIRLSRKFDGLDMSGRYNPSRILACIDLCNRTFIRLPSVRLFTISCLDKLRDGYKVLFSETGDEGVFSTQPTNHHLWTTRFHNDDYQCDCVKHGGIRIKPNPPVTADEDIRLYEWLRSTRFRTEFSDEFCSRVSIRSPGSISWGRKASAL